MINSSVLIEFKNKPKSIYLYSTQDGQLAGIGKHLVECLNYYKDIQYSIHKLMSQQISMRIYINSEDVPIFKYYYLVERVNKYDHWITVKKDNEQVFSGFLDWFIDNVNEDIKQYNKWVEARLQTGKYCPCGMMSLVE